MKYDQFTDDIPVERTDIQFRITTMPVGDIASEHAELYRGEGAIFWTCVCGISRQRNQQGDPSCHVCGEMDLGDGVG